MPSFWPDVELTTNAAKPTQFDRACNLQIKQLAAKMNWFVSHSLKLGAVRFKVLRASLVRQGNTPARAERRVRRLLDWYVREAPKRRDDPNFPKLPTGKNFCDQIGWVERLYDKDKASKPRKVSKLAAKIADDLSQVMYWKKGSSTQLPQVVHDSLKNLGRFCRRLDELDVSKIPVKVSKKRFLRLLRSGQVGMTAEAAKLPEKSHLRNYVKGAKKSHRARLQSVKDVVLSMFSGGEAAFLERWLTHFNKRLRDWKDWSGNMTWLVFKPDHQEWDKMVKDRLKEYGGVSMFPLWEEIQRRLK